MLLLFKYSLFIEIDEMLTFCTKEKWRLRFTYDLELKMQQNAKALA